MTKPSNERRELNCSTHELSATELNTVIGGTFFKFLSDILKAQSDTQKSIARNVR
jgi:bacteriocin-like protein